MQTRRHFLEGLTAANIARMAAKVAPASLISLGAPRPPHAEVVTVVVVVLTTLAAIAKEIADPIDGIFHFVSVADIGVGSAGVLASPP